MRVSYDWLKTMIDIPEDPKTLSDEYIRTGTEVEAIDTVGESFDHVVTAKVLTKTPHPDSDHMYVCSVDVGDKNLDADGNPAPLQIVCGAQNFEAGDHIVTAMIGAVLPGDVKIKKFLNNVIQEELAPIRARRAEFEKDIPAVYEILKKGSDVAREAAAQTLSEVKRAMKINYFDDEELIRAQSEKYSGISD